MKRLVVYYSLSGNTEEAAKKIAEKLNADLLKLETKKRMPKSFAAQILVGGGQVMMNRIPELMPYETNIDDYDDIVLGSPIWNSKGVPAVNAFLKDKNAAKKVTALFFLSAGGDTVEITDDEHLIINGNTMIERGIFESTPRYKGFVDYPLTLPENTYFVLVDKRDGGEDSRYYGPVKLDEILGTVITIVRRTNL